MTDNASAKGYLLGTIRECGVNCVPCRLRRGMTGNEGKLR